MKGDVEHGIEPGIEHGIGYKGIWGYRDIGVWYGMVQYNII